MSTDDLKLVLMSVGTTVALISLILVIRNRAVDKRKGLRVTYTVQAMLGGVEAQYLGLVIRVYALNTGNVNLHVHRPAIKLPFKKDGFDTFELVSFKDKSSYPLKLEPGAEHSVEMDLRQMLESFSYLKWYRRVAFEVRDSTGKIYRSKKIFFKKILDQAKLDEALGAQNA